MLRKVKKDWAVGVCLGNGTVLLHTGYLISPASIPDETGAAQYSKRGSWPIRMAVGRLLLIAIAAPIVLAIVLIAAIIGIIAEGIDMLTTIVGEWRRR